MGTRQFHPVEQKDSRIKWERADAETAQGLVLALGKQRQGLMGMAVWFALLFPFVILLILLVGFFIKMIRNPSPVDTASIVFSIFCFAFISVIFLVRYLRERPYLHPEKQREIWIFRAKCADISMTWRGQNHRRYSAYFQKGGIHIRIPIQWAEHNSDPRGKEYVFYKFNHRTGNPWVAIAADELESG